VGKVVNPIATRVRCEMHPCKERAAFSLCEDGRRQVAFNVCEGHLRQIIEEGLVALKMLEEIEPEETVVVVEAEPTGLTDEDKIAPESDESMPKEATAPEPEEVTGEQETEAENAKETEPEHDSNEPVPSVAEEESVTEEVYTCKHCGATFPKTGAGRSALMIHSKNCPSKPPKG